MPREAPWKFWLTEADEKNQFRIPTEAAQEVRWLKRLTERPAVCKGMMMPTGTIRIAPFRGRLKREWRWLENTFRSQPPRDDEAAHPRMALARYFASMSSIIVLPDAGLGYPVCIQQSLWEIRKRMRLAIVTVKPNVLEYIPLPQKTSLDTFIKEQAKNVDEQLRELFR